MNRLTEQEYLSLLPVKSVWEVYKKNQTVTGISIHLKNLSEIFTRLNGYAPDTSCGSCNIDTLNSVMRNFDENELLIKAKIPIVVEKTIDKVFEIVKKDYENKKKRGRPKKNI